MSALQIPSSLAEVQQIRADGQRLKAGRELSEAIHQLKQSERGRRALVAFRKFIEADNGSAASLDCNNQRAIEALARSCRIFGAWTVRDAIPSR
jgi:hypothetical protein